jgi:hypothetical protein
MSKANEFARAFALALTVAIGPAALAQDGIGLAAMLGEAIDGGDYATPKPDELQAAEALFRRLALGTPAEALGTDAAALDMEIVSDGTLLILREHPAAHRGRGFYAFRRGSGGDVLHVPHGFKDEMTREIGLALFLEGRFAAAGWNTVPRNYERDGARVDADLAHVPGSWFTAFARGTATAWPRGRTLQLHGFAKEKRRSPAGAGAAMILSNGTEAPQRALQALRDCLAQGLKHPAALYPQDVRELGGTSNVQGEALRQMRYAGFLHLETSRDLRQRLRDERPLRAALLDCLQS